MGKIIVQDTTTKSPLDLIGREAGICWGTPISDVKKNVKRAWGCIESGHGRTMEFPDVYLTIDGYSARVIRELYTHIGGSPTRLQASTRYIDYAGKGFNYIIPHSIDSNTEALNIYNGLMRHINEELNKLENVYNIPKEDVANGLPLGMTTKVVLKINLRTLVEMSHQRLCTRAYWEFRELMHDIMNALSDYSEEWAEIVDILFVPKCHFYGYCTEENRGLCKRRPTKEQFFNTYRAGIIAEETTQESES